MGIPPAASMAAKAGRARCWRPGDTSFTDLRHQANGRVVKMEPDEPTLGARMACPLWG